MLRSPAVFRRCATAGISSRCSMMLTAGNTAERNKDPRRDSRRLHLIL